MIRKLYTSILSFLLLATTTFAQTAPDFTFTDVNGDTHTLSESLAEGKVILLDFFFVDCGPCITWHPEFEQLATDYEDSNLEIWAISDIDSEAYINSSIFSPTHSNQKIAGIEGGALDVLNLYRQNFNFTGYPTYSVICSDGSITWDIWPLSAGINQVRSQLTEECGVSFNVGVSGVEQLSSISAYPNPANEAATLEFNLETSTNMTIGLFNTLGQSVMEIPMANYNAAFHNINIDVADLAEGLYTIRLQSDEGVESVQLSIAR